MRIHSFTGVVLAAIAIASPAFAAEPQKSQPPGAPAAASQGTARLRFDPAGKAWSGETDFKGASWSALGPGLEKGVHMMRARAGVGDSFPVQEKGGGATLFNVKLVEGDDARLLLEISGNGDPRKVEVARDKRAQVEVAGTKYELLFPTTSVAAKENENPSTNKATIFVTRR